MPINQKWFSANENRSIEKKITKKTTTRRRRRSQKCDRAKEKGVSTSVILYEE